MSPSSPVAKKSNVKMIVIIVLALVASLFIVNRYVDLPFTASSNSVYNPLKTYRKDTATYLKAVRKDLTHQELKDYKKDVKAKTNAIKCYQMGREVACKRITKDN